MGKITVETCEIEGLKIITPRYSVMPEGISWRLIITMILKQREFRKCLYRINQSASKKSSQRTSFPETFSAGQAGTCDPRRSL